MKPILIILLAAPIFVAYGQSDSRISAARSYLGEKTKDQLPEANFTINQKNLFKERQQGKEKAQLSLLERNHIADSNHMSNFVDSIVETLKAANSDINASTQGFIHKSLSFNAFTFGDDILFINASLVYECRNVDELAYVIAHEIAHNSLKHSHSAMVHQIETMANSEIASEVKAAGSQEYGNVTALNKLMLPLIMADKELSRQHEYEADSLGMIYLRNAGYNPEKAIGIFDIILYYSTPAKGAIDLSGLPQDVSGQLSSRLSHYSRANSLGFSAKTETDWDNYLTSHPFPDQRYGKMIQDFKLSGNYTGSDAEKLHGKEVYTEVSDIAFEQGELSVYTYMAVENFNRYAQARENAAFGFEAIGMLKERFEAGKHLEKQSLLNPEDFDQFCYILNNETSEDYFTLSEMIREESDYQINERSFQEIIWQIIELSKTDNKETLKILWEANASAIDRSGYSWYLEFLENFLYQTKRYSFVKQPK